MAKVVGEVQRTCGKRSNVFESHNVLSLPSLLMYPWGWPRDYETM